MSYVPTNWVNGDTITAEKLNKIENGISAMGGVKVVSCVHDALTETFANILEAFTNGTPVFIFFDNDDQSYTMEFVEDLENWDIKRVYATDGELFECVNADDYPHRPAA